jgi:hypothetical protein
LPPRITRNFDVFGAMSKAPPPLGEGARVVLLYLSAFSDFQSILNVDTEIPNCTFNFRVSKQNLDSAQVIRLFVDDGCFRAAQGMCAIILWPESDASHPFINQAGILTGTYVIRVINPAGKDKIIDCTSTAFEPSKHTAASRLKNFELNRPASLLLHNNRAPSDVTATDDVADLDLYDVIASELAINGQVEHSAVPDAPLMVEPKSYRPNLLRLKRPLGADLPARVPRPALFLDLLNFQMFHEESPL